ncbi:MAG TPA: hypothetical protein ENJ88_04750 [Phaeodactylibacter sp.]|nr:hypothetical protein [Phaeodactylibacter sp.]
MKYATKQHTISQTRKAPRDYSTNGNSKGMYGGEWGINGEWRMENGKLRMENELKDLATCLIP